MTSSYFWSLQLGRWSELGVGIAREVEGDMVWVGSLQNCAIPYPGLGSRKPSTARCWGVMDLMYVA